MPIEPRFSVDPASLRELQANFRALEVNAQGAILRAAALEGAKVVRDEARRIAPRAKVGSKGGWRGIEARMSRKRKGRTWEEAEVGYNKRGWWLRFQELGTRHHAAQPHLRPALHSKRAQVLEVMARVFRLGIEAVTSRVRRP